LVEELVQSRGNLVGDCFAKFGFWFDSKTKEGGKEVVDGVGEFRLVLRSGSGVFFGRGDRYWSRSGRCLLLSSGSGSRCRG
jgi:hypothetical protein